jgi:hypothetical protein
MQMPAIREPASTSVDMDSFAAASLRREYKLGAGIRKMIIEAARIERGDMPGWAELPTDKEIAIKVMLAMNYIDSLPESVEDMKPEQPSAAG